MSEARSQNQTCMKRTPTRRVHSAKKSPLKAVWRSCPQERAVLRLASLRSEYLMTSPPLRGRDLMALSLKAHLSTRPQSAPKRISSSFSSLSKTIPSATEGLPDSG